jgi:hypothetical protein
LSRLLIFLYYCYNCGNLIYNILFASYLQVNVIDKSIMFFLPRSDLGKILIIIIFLMFTNPPKSLLVKNSQAFVDIKKTNGIFQSYFSSMSDYLGFNIRNSFIKSKSYKELDCIIFTVMEYSKVSANRIRSNSINTFFIGISGFWIHPDYWNSLPGMLLIINYIYSYIMSLKYNRSFIVYWFEIVLVSLFYCYNTLYLLQSLYYSEDKVSIIILASFFMLNCLVVLILHPSKLFYDYRNPCSYVYGVTSSIFMIITLSNEFIMWNGNQFNSMQFLIGLVIYQLTNRQTYGLAGSITGFIIYKYLNRQLL